MNLLLWVLQGLLALVYVAHGWLLLFPPPEIAQQMNAALPRGLTLFLGIAELAAAAGLVLPGLTRFLPWLVPCAAAGLIPIMAGATVHHLRRGEYSSAVITVVLLVLVSLVAYLRWRVLPITPRKRRPA